MIKLLRITSIVRKLTAKSNNTIRPLQLFRTSTYRKEVWNDHVDEAASQKPNPKEVTLFSKSYSYVYDKIDDYTTVNEIFQFVNESEKNIKGHQAVHLLISLMNICKKNQFHHDKITASSEFSTLCNILKRDIRNLSTKNVIKALKVLHYYNISSSAVIVQMLFQILRESINNLTLRELLLLKVILDKSPKTPLVEALSISIPIILNTNTKTQLYGENVDTLVKLLEYFCSVSHDHTILSSIINAINNADKSLMTLNQAKIVMKSLKTLRYDDSNLKLLRKCQQIIIDSLDNFNAFQIINLVRNICFSTRASVLYNERLMDACATTIISKDMGMNVAIRVLSYLTNLKHTNNALLDYISARCLKITNVEKEIDGAAMKIFIYGMSFADYKPVFWESLKSVILTEKLLNNPIHELISLSNFLATLDCYWPPLLRKIYTMHHEGLSRIVLKRLYFSYKVVKMKYPEYNGPWPSEKLINICESLPMFFQQKCNLKSVLESALGGSQYIMNNVLTSFGYHIDHAVLMRKGGFPVAINNTNHNISFKIEDLKSPPDGQIIFFIVISERGIACNTQRHSGHWSLIIRLLESQPNHTVILIQTPMWMNMTEPERFRYISQAIRLKCDELSTAVIS